MVKRAVSSPKRNAAAFHLERLQKLWYGVPPFQKVLVWHSGAFRLSLSTVYHSRIITDLEELKTRLGGLIDEWAQSIVSDVNKDWTCKDKDKNQAYKDQDKD